MSLGAARPAVRIAALRATVAELPLAPLAVAVVTAVAFGLRLSQLHQSLFGDEVLAYHEVVRHSLAGVVRAVRTGVESSPPLFFVLAWASAKLGDPTIWIRLPSLILGTATIPIVYLLGRETVGRVPGVIGAAVLAVSPFSLYYGVEARPYATLAFCCALSTYALVRAVRTRAVRWWALYALAAAAAAYTHYTAIFVLAIQGLWSLWACRDRLGQPLLAAGSALVLYAPWVPQIHGTALGVYGTLEPRTLHNVVVDVAKLIPGYPYARLSAIPTHVGLAIVGAIALLGLVAAGWRARRAWPEQLPDLLGSPMLIVALALATPVGVLLYSILRTDIWGARNLYASVPAAALVLGALLAALPRGARLAGVAGVLAVLAFGAARAVSPTYARPPLRAAAQYLDRVAGPRDPVIMYPSFLGLTTDILAQFHDGHPVLQVPRARWPRNISARSAYLVIDDAVAVVEGIPVPHPRGYALVSRRHYTGLMNFTVLGYRRLS